MVLWSFILLLWQQIQQGYIRIISHHLHHMTLCFQFHPWLGNNLILKLLLFSFSTLLDNSSKSRFLVQYVLLLASIPSNLCNERYFSFQFLKKDWRTFWLHQLLSSLAKTCLFQLLRFKLKHLIYDWLSNLTATFTSSK